MADAIFHSTQSVASVASVASISLASVQKTAAPPKPTTTSKPPAAKPTTSTTTSKKIKTTVTHKAAGKSTTTKSHSGTSTATAGAAVAKGSSGPSGGVIAAIVIIVLLVVAGAGFLFWRRRRQQQSRQKSGVWLESGAPYSGSPAAAATGSANNSSFPSDSSYVKSYLFGGKGQNGADSIEPRPFTGLLSPAPPVPPKGSFRDDDENQEKQPGSAPLSTSGALEVHQLLSPSLPSPAHSPRPRTPELPPMSAGLETPASAPLDPFASSQSTASLLPHFTAPNARPDSGPMVLYSTPRHNNSDYFSPSSLSAAASTSVPLMPQQSTVLSSETTRATPASAYGMSPMDGNNGNGLMTMAPKPIPIPIPVPVPEASPASPVVAASPVPSRAQSPFRAASPGAQSIGAKSIAQTISGMPPPPAYSMMPMPVAGPSSMPAAAPAQPTSAPPPSNFTNPLSPTASVIMEQKPTRKVYAVIRTYLPTLLDELRVSVGDRVIVVNEFDDGWGYCERLGDKDGAAGVVPLECLDRSRNLANVGGTLLGAGGVRESIRLKAPSPVGSFASIGTNEAELARMSASEAADPRLSGTRFSSFQVDFESIGKHH